MNEYWLDAGAISGNGSQSSPYGSYAELLASETLESSDEVYMRGIFFEDIAFNDGFDMYSVKRWPGFPQAKIRPCTVAEFDTVHDATGTYDVLVTTATFATKPTELVQDWEIEDNKRLYGQGNGSGFMVETTETLLASAITDLKANVGRWFYDSSTDLIYCSVPKGDVNEDHVWYVTNTGTNNSNGAAVSISGTIGTIILDLDISLGTKTASAQDGNGIDCSASFDKIILISPNIQACYYHNFVTRGNSHGEVVLMDTYGKPLFASAYGGNDGIFTLYAGVAWPGEMDIDEVTIYGYNLRDTQGNLYKEGSVKGFGHHNNGDDVGPNAIRFNDCVYRRDPLATVDANPAVVMTAGNIKHTIPTGEDLKDPLKYSVVFTDCDLEGGIVIGGGTNSNISFARRRCKIHGDMSQVASGLAGAGISHVTAGSGSVTVWYTESCASDHEQADVNSRSLLSFGNANTKIVGRNESFLGRGSGFSNSPAILTGSSTTGLVDFQGCQFDAESDIHFMQGSIDIGDENQVILQDNLYSTTLHATARPSSPIILMSTVESTIDPTGEFNTNPVYAESDSLEPDLATQKVKSAKVTGPNGINKLAFSKQFGAFQFGLIRPPVGRRRSRRSSTNRRGSLRRT